MPTLQGPHGPIEYARDDLGYPSVRARDFLDGTWARGWFHARDRLAQVHLVLALARGRALEIVGDTTVARTIDRAVRLHDLAGGLSAQVARMGAPARAMLDAYCQGFAAGAAARGWPWVLRLAGVKPARLTPEDVVLTYRMVAWFGLTSLVEWAETIVAELAADGVDPRFLLGDAAGSGDIPRLTWPRELSMLGTAAVGGSNAIAVAAAHSRTGGALLLADPHLEVGRIPPVLYAMHAEHASGGYVQGLGVPGLAWTSFGRNERVAWAFTYGHADAVDVYAVRCRRGEAWDGSAWRPLARRVCKVVVKKKPDETWVYWDAPMGTIVGEADRDAEVTLPCLRWSGLAETFRDLDACAATVRAKGLDEVVEAQRWVSTLSLHAVLASADGRVAQVTTGRVEPGPLVPRTGAIPEPLPESARPVRVDPPEGFVVSANERRDGPAGERWVPLPEPGYRHERLTEQVSAGPCDLGDLARFACDAVDAGARRLVAAWAERLPAEAAALVGWAANQPGTGEEHFAQLTLFTALHHEATRALLASHLGEARAGRLLDDLGGMILFQHHLDRALEGLDASALAEAWARAKVRAARPELRLPVTLPFKNIFFAGKLPRFLGLDSAPVVNPGGPTTPNQARVVDILGERLAFGASGRYLCDLSRPGGWYCMPGGASEQRFGPGYARGLEAWGRGEFAPLGPAEGPAPRGGS